MAVDPAQLLNVTMTANGASSTKASTASSSLDKDGFLKLLSAQMANQDPQSSQDPSQYFQTISSMTMVEQLTNLAASSAQSVKMEQTASATSLIGLTVTYKDKDGNAQTGTLESVQVGTGTDAKTTVTVAGAAGIDPSLISEVK
jgi:flagellar basal-body rod modification protein FlgD